MKRTKGKTEKAPGTIRFINRGGTHYTADGRKIIKGQKFDALPSDIPTAFRDVLIPLDAEAARQAAPQVLQAEYKIKAHMEDGEPTGDFDILDARGKVINEAPMEEEAANALVARLME